MPHVVHFLAVGVMVVIVSDVTICATFRHACIHFLLNFAGLSHEKSQPAPSRERALPCCNNSRVFGDGGYCHEHESPDYLPAAVNDQRSNGRGGARQNGTWFGAACHGCEHVHVL